MYLVLVLIAAVAYSLGGIYMKLSAGLSQLLPSLFVYLFFAAGASMQTLAMDKKGKGEGLKVKGEFIPFPFHLSPFFGNIPLKR